MRRAPTSAEAVLWDALRNGALSVHFRRQHVVDRFVVDFCCLRAKLVVEVDGTIHDRQRAPDAARDAALRERGFQVLRFPNERVLNDIAQVLSKIREALAALMDAHGTPSQTRSPSPVGEGAGG